MARVGVPRERIVLLGRARRTSGRPGRPARAARARSSTSTGARSSVATTTCPGDDNERFLEYWNLVFMQYDQDPPGKLTPLPSQNIDTGLGLNRMAAIQQNVPSVYETDQFRPLIELGEELSGRRMAESHEVDPRPAHPGRPLARHDLPHRRRRRALQRGPRLHPAPRHAPRDPAGPACSASSPATCRASPTWSPRSWAASTPSSSSSARRSSAGSRARRRRSGARWTRARKLLERAHRARARRGLEGIGAGRRLPAARHLRLPVRPHARARRRAGPGRGRGPASRR